MNSNAKIDNRRMQVEREQNNSNGIPSGILALALLGRKFGLDVDAGKVARENQIQGSEVSTSLLVRCATSLGMHAKGLRLNLEDLKDLKAGLPAIMILRDGEALILLRIDGGQLGGSLLLQDPRLGEELAFSVDYSQISALWSGEIVLVQRGRSNQTDSELFSTAMIAGLLLQERRVLWDIFITAVAMSLLALTPIMFFRIASNRIIPYHAFTTFVVVCIVTAILIVFEVAFGVLRRYLLLRITTRVDVKLYTTMFARVIHLPIDFFERTPAGLILHKMSQIGRIRSFLVGQLFGTMLDAGILLFFLPMMFFISPLLTSIVMVFGACICAWIVAALPTYRRKSGAVEAAEANRGAFLSQTIQGIKTVKTLSLESRQLNEWDLLTAKVAEKKFEEGRVINIIQAVVLPLERLMITGSFGVGVYIATTTSEPDFIGTLFTFLLLSQRLAAPLIQASQLINQYDEARTAVAVVGSLTNQAPEEGRSGDGVRNQIQGHLEFSKVLFSYKGALRPALREVSFEIAPGTTLGVMGRSGSGKTTVTRLIQRLHSEYQGLIKIDGVDVRQYDLTHLRSSLGVVLQENFLFSGTIRSNITIAKPDATFEEMIHAARLAGAEEFIEKLPGGYETQIYEGSPNLSGGQRQRLAIARALITDPKILILDEATSALDAESEAIVNANIDRIATGRTVITISHRLASLVKADAILVMEQGEVNDIGKHHELLERNEIYAHLWYTQNPHTAPTGGTSGAKPAPAAQITYRGPANAA